MPFGRLTSFTFLTSPHTSAKAPTIGGWTPGVRELVEGRVLSCGCLAGCYETWTKAVVTIIDAPADTCRIEGHVKNAVI
jgi:hypothetical protein